LISALQDHEIEAIRAGRPSDFADPLEREVLFMSRAILSGGDLADGDYAEAEASVGFKKYIAAELALLGPSLTPTK
jgi:hypothetical protein